MVVGAAPPRPRALSALAFRDFRFLLLGSLAVNLAMPLQFLTQIFWVQEHYANRAVLWVGLIAASRGVAGIVFSLVGGAVADRYERRHVLLACQVASLGVNAVIAALMLTRPVGEWTLAPLLACTFLAGSVMAVDMPARAASIPAVVGMENLTSGISLNTMAMQLSIPLTLPLVGILNGLFAPGAVYAGSLLIWGVSIPLVASLRFRSRGGAGRAVGVFGDIAEGLSYVRGNAAIFGVIGLILVVQVVGMPGVATLGPVWMTSVLGLSETEFGFMGMTWGLGGLASSLYWVRHQDRTRRGSTLCGAVVLFALSVIVFGHSRSIAVTAVANFALGFAMVGSMVSSSTITQHLVAESVRGRVMGLFPLAMGLATLSAAPVSVLAQATSLELVVPLLGWLTLVFAGSLIVARPAVRRIMPAPEEAPPAPPTVAALGAAD